MIPMIFAICCAVCFSLYVIMKWINLFDIYRSRKKQIALLSIKICICQNQVPVV